MKAAPEVLIRGAASPWEKDFKLNLEPNPMKKAKKKIKVRDMKPKKNPKAGGPGHVAPTGIGHPAPTGIGKPNPN
jgi:hypothetical protein